MKERASKESTSLQERVFVATPLDRAIGMDRIQAFFEASITDFNRNSLPILKKYGLFNSKNFTDYLEMTTQVLTGLIVKKELEKKTFESEEEKQIFIIDRTASLKEELSSFTPICQVRSEYMTAVYYEESRGEFCLDRKAVERNFGLYAEDPKSIRVFNRLQELVNTWNSFKKSEYASILSVISLPNTATGEVSIKGVMRREEWEEFVNSQED